jgi:hypothetical protein
MNTRTQMGTGGVVIPERPIPFALRLLGARWRDSGRTFRMAWGEVTFGRPGWALGLSLFDDPPHFSLHIQLWRIANVYVRLPFLRRFAREPEEMMETWGGSYDAEMGTLVLRWGAKYKHVNMPWRNWQHIAHDVRRPDGSWVPFVGSWECDKEPDRRQTETHPYHYLLQSGEKQDRIATIHVERRIWRLAGLRWTSRFQRVSHSIDVSFNEEVGEGTGSWKGGTTGCGYELRPNETPRECLRRMERDRRFT